MKNITLQFKNSCAGCSRLHGANHKVSCDKNQLIYTSGIKKGMPKIYHLEKAYSNPYQWPFDGIPYVQWLRARICAHYDYSE